MKTIKQIMLPTLVLIASTVSCQITSWDPEYEDFNYEKVAIKQLETFQKPKLLERDIKYTKRIHRIIDLRQKVNNVLSWERNPLVRNLHNAVLSGEVYAYYSDSLSMTVPYTTEEAKDLGSYEIITKILDWEYHPEEVYKDTVFIEKIEWFSIKKIRIMEEWIFDAQHSTFKPRIIGLALMHQPIIEGVILNEQPLYWLKMDEIRPYLTNMEIFSRHNNSARVNADDFFEMRLFDSYIVKEENIFDLDIAQLDEYNGDNLSILLRGEIIKNDLFIFEHDIWEY
jgi:gliding motility associated protien GldN